MLKQWKNTNLNVIYFYIPNSKNNEILTSDGVLLPYNIFKSMTAEEYQNKKNTSSLYDYNLSKQSERLVKKAIDLTPTNTQDDLPKGVNKSTNEFAKTSNTYINTISPKIETLKTEVVNSEKKEKTLPQKKIKVPKQITESTLFDPSLLGDDFEKDLFNKEITEDTKSTEHKIEVKPIENKVEVKPTKIKVTSKQRKSKNHSKQKKEINLFDFAYPKIMLVIMIVCCCLSVYFTGTYLQRLQIPIVAYAISASMLLYGLIGSQMTRKAWKSKHYLSAIIFGVTATCTIGFSMLSSIDVNYAKYKDKHSAIEETYNTNNGKKLSYNLMKEELAENKKQIDLLNEDIKFQQTQWSIMWDNELKKNIVLEGRISATAQQKITDDNKRIEELTKRNREINSTLMKYAESGVSVENIESKTDRAKSLTDLVGAMIGVSANVIQLIFLLIPSFFIDAINVLSLQIYVMRFEKKEEKD